MSIALELAGRFATIVTAVSLLCAGLAVYAREVRSHASRPHPLERDAGPLALVNWAGIGLFVVLGPALAITQIGSIATIGEPASGLVRVLGLATLSAAGVLEVWGGRTMGRHLVSAAEVRPDTELITTGPFGIVRHPMYLAILLIWLGGALAMLNAALAAGFVAFVPAFELRARLEERMLSRHFGAAYTVYAARVPRLLPRPTRGRGTIG